MTDENRIIIPPQPSPMAVRTGLLRSNDGTAVILIEASNLSGSVCTGILAADQAHSLGRGLLSLARDAMSKQLITPPNVGLVSANGHPLSVVGQGPDEAEPAEPSEPDGS